MPRETGRSYSGLRVSSCRSKGGEPAPRRSWIPRTDRQHALLNSRGAQELQSLGVWESGSSKVLNRCSWNPASSDHKPRCPRGRLAKAVPERNQRSAVGLKQNSLCPVSCLQNSSPLVLTLSKISEEQGAQTLGMFLSVKPAG